MAYRTAIGVFVCVVGAMVAQCASGGSGDTVCGNGVCEAGEDQFTCARDCSSTCGNMICETTETTQLCPGDCYCGNGTCDAGETSVSCTADCSSVTCGNGICEMGETGATCPQDCPNTCGNSVCDTGETSTNCPTDCSSAVCGNGTCDTGETATSCPADCSSAVCGNGTCETGETATSCPADCSVASCGDGNCDVGETASNCPADCGTCGNGTCDTNENSSNCPADCTGCQDTVCDLYPQCGCSTGTKCSLDTNNARTCVSAGTGSVGTHCTADTDCVAGSICLGRSDTEGQCLSWCGSSSDCSGAGGYCSDLVDANSNPITGAAVCTITCSPANPSAACGAGFGCEIYQDSNTLELFTDCHGMVGTATEGGACDDSTETYCAAGLFCNSNTCYRWCASTSDCVGGGSCDTSAFSTPLTIGTTTYGVCL